MKTPRVDGLAVGNRVQYLGLSVGRVSDIQLSESMTEFDVTLLIRPDNDVPSNVMGVIAADNLISGSAAVDLELTDPVAQGTLSGGTIPGEFAGTDLIPPAFSALADEMQALIAELRAANVVATLNTQAEKIGDLADSLNAVVSDEEMQADLKTTIAGIRDLTATADTVLVEYRELGERINGLQDKTDVLFADAQQITGEAKTALAEVNAAATSARSTIEKSGQNIEQLSEELLTSVAEANKIMTGI